MGKRPNILIFMTDQQRGNSVYPYNKAYTPNIEKLAKEGICFAQAHTIAPHCCPSRASLWSGLFPSQHGVWNNVKVGNALSRGLYDGVTLFPEYFQKAGYRTYYTGKWHVSNIESPSDRGFDMYSKEADGFQYEPRNNKRPSVTEWKQYEDYTPQSVRGEGEIIRRGYKTYTHYATSEKKMAHDKIVADCGMNIIKNRAEIDKKYGIKKPDDAPWLQVISGGAPHDPYFAPQRFLDMYDIDGIKLPANFCDTMEDKPALYRKTAERFHALTEREHKEALRHYWALCSYQDYLFGEVLKELEKSGEADNTIVLYISDHGDYNADHGLWCKGLPCFEGAYHIPMVMRWPGHIKNPGRVINDFTCITDIAPTMLDICDIPYESENEIIGTSLKPYLLNETPKHVQDTLYTQSNGNELYGIQRSARTHEWKYVYNGYDFDELYDLKNDPNEMVNVYEKYKDSEILKELSKKMWAFAKRTDDVCVNPYIMVGLSSYGPGVLFEK